MKMKLTSVAAVLIAAGMMLSPGMAYAYDGCGQICPVGSGLGDEVTVTMTTNTENLVIYIAHAQDPTWWQIDFQGTVFSTESDPDFFPGDGSIVFTLTQEMLDAEYGSVWNDSPEDHWYVFDTVPFLATGTTCANGFGCDDVDLDGEAFNPFADPTNQGPTEVPSGAPVGGVAGLALLIIAGASGGAFAIRKRS